LTGVLNRKLKTYLSLDLDYCLLSFAGDHVLALLLFTALTYAFTYTCSCLKLTTPARCTSKI